VPILGSPWTVPIERGPDAPDPTQFDVFGPGIERGDTAGPCIFTIVAKNSAGQQIKVGGVPVGVEVFSPNGSELLVNLVDNDDGTFTATYQPQDPGDHKVDVVLRTKIPLYYDHVKDSTYTVPVVAGTDAKASLVWGPGLEDVYDTKPAVFYIKAKDREGNDMGRGGDPFKVEITGPSGIVPCEVTDNNDGTYDVKYEPNDHGEHTIAVTLRDKPVAQSPYRVNVKEGADYNHTCIERFQFIVRSKTKANQNKPVGGETLGCNIAGPNGPVFDVLMKDIGDGTYICDYSLPTPGKYQLSVKLNGHDIQGSPFIQDTSK
jgi:hypothetical protein